MTYEELERLMDSFVEALTEMRRIEFYREFFEYWEEWSDNQ